MATSARPFITGVTTSIALFATLKTACAATIKRAETDILWDRGALVTGVPDAFEALGAAALQALSPAAPVYHAPAAPIAAGTFLTCLCAVSLLAVPHVPRSREVRRWILQAFWAARATWRMR